MTAMTIAPHQDQWRELLRKPIEGMLATVEETLQIMDENVDSRVVMMQCCRKLHDDLINIEDGSSDQTLLLERLLEATERILEERDAARTAYSALVNSPIIPLDKLAVLKLNVLPDRTRAAILRLVDAATRPQSDDTFLCRLISVLESLPDNGG